MSMGSSSGGNEAQDEYNDAQWEYNWDRMQDANDFAKDQRIASEFNADTLRSIENRTNANEHAFEVAGIKREYRDALKAYNAGKKASDRQLQANQEAEALAIDNAARVLNDIYTDVDFQQQELLLNHNNLIETSTLRSQDLDAQYGFVEQRADIQERELVGNRNITYSRGDLRNREIDNKLDTTRANAAVQRLGVAQGVRSAAEVAGLDARGLILELESIRNESSTKVQDAMLQSLQQTGTIANTGQTGRSARRNIESAMAQLGRTTATINSAVNRSQSETGLNMARIAQRLNDAQTRGEIDYTRIANDVVAAGNEALLATDAVGIDMNAADLVYDIGLDTVVQTRAEGEWANSFGQSMVQQDLRAGEQKYNLGIAQTDATLDSADAENSAQLRQIGMDRRQADLQAQAMIPTEPVQPTLDNGMIPKAPIRIPTPRIPEPPSTVTEEEYDAINPPESTGGGGGGFLGVALQIASIGAQYAAAAGSDDRFKKDLNRVGTSPTGIPIYSFKYIGDGEHAPRYQGTSAQDLLEMGRSDAVFQKEKDGFYYVDYSKLDVDFEQVTAI